MALALGRADCGGEAVALKRPTPRPRPRSPRTPAGRTPGRSPARRPTGSRMRPSAPTSPSSTTNPPASASTTVAAADRRATAAEDRRRAFGSADLFRPRHRGGRRRLPRRRVRPGRPHEPGHVDHRRSRAGGRAGRWAHYSAGPTAGAFLETATAGRSGGAAERFSRRPAPVLVPLSRASHLGSPWLPAHRSRCTQRGRGAR